MKANYFNIQGKKEKSIELPEQFSEPIRPDLIHKAVLVVQSNNRQQNFQKEEGNTKEHMVEVFQELQGKQHGTEEPNLD